MGNTQILTSENLDAATLNLLSFSGLSSEQLQMRKVVVDDAGNQITTFCVESDAQLPNLVVVHGYGASGAIQYKIFKHLSDHFNLYMIDLIGMGSSSRPVFECTTGAEADIYMIEYLEKWRIAMNNMTGFILAGSSYGGYIVGTYAAKYPQHISKLLLLSPLGLKIPPDGWTPDRSGFRQGTQDVPPKLVQKFMHFYWGKFGPWDFARKLNHTMAKIAVSSFVKKGWPGRNQDELNALIEYLYQIQMRQGTTEYALFLQFDSNLHALKPLAADDRLGGLETIPFPISIVFGENDWMDSRGSAQIIKRNKHFASGSCNLYVLKNSGHRMTTENPEGLAHLIINDANGTFKSVFQPKMPSYQYFSPNGDSEIEEWNYDKVLFPTQQIQ